MCFRIDLEYPNELVVENDILCYKHMYKVGKYFCSPVYPTKWLPGVLIKARGRSKRRVLAVGKDNTIEAGIHSYNIKSVANIHRKYGEIIAQCKIPKGSRYYANDHQYVSDRIIIVKEVKWLPKH